MNIRALVIAGAMMVGGSLTAFGQQASDANFVLVKSVVGSGGVAASDGTYQLNGTVGQAVIGQSTDASFTVDHGFWWSIPLKGAVKNNYDGPAAGFALEQNYPNPFNPSTTIRFSIPERMKVTIRVLNLLGEEVKKAVDGETFEAGTRSIEFAADDLPSGTYVYRLEAGNYVASKKMVLVK